MRYEMRIIIDNEDRSEDNLALYLEGVLANHFDVDDIEVRPLE